MPLRGWESRVTAARGLRDRLRARPADVIDVFGYVVVLNLAVEYLPAVISEGSTWSTSCSVTLSAWAASSR